MTAAWVTIPLDEYERLRAAASHHPARRGGPGTNPLAEAVAAIAANQAGVQLPLDADPQRVIKLLATITAAVLEATTTDHGADILQALGLEATHPHWNHP